MKILAEFKKKTVIDMTCCDGVILALKDYSVMGKDYYTLEEIEKIASNNLDKDIFVSLNRNFFNADISYLKDILLRLENSKVKGILFYDLAILQLKKELNLKIPLVWNQTHMVNNYKTCDYYFSRGVEYALLGKEITLDEVVEIIKKSSIKCMVEVVGCASVAFSKRKLLTNYYTDLGKEVKNELNILERVSNDNYIVKEENSGTGFYKEKITNGTGIIKDLYNAGCEYIIMRDDLEKEEDFYELLKDTKQYILEKCGLDSYVSKYKKLGDYTNFFFNKTIYKVKKNG